MRPGNMDLIGSYDIWHIVYFIHKHKQAYSVFISVTMLPHMVLYIYYKGVHLWNNCSKSMKTCRTPRGFKHIFKNIILNIQDGLTNR